MKVYNLLLTNSKNTGKVNNTEKNGNKKAKILADCLDIATEWLLLIH